MATPARYTLLLTTLLTAALGSTAPSGRAVAQSPTFAGPPATRLVPEEDPPPTMHDAMHDALDDLTERRAATPAEIGSMPPPTDDEIQFDGGWASLVSSGTWLSRGRWFTSSEATMLHRSSTPRQQLSADAVVITIGGVPVLQPVALLMDTNSAGFGYQPGARITIGRYLGRDGDNRDHMLEFTFLGLNSWETGTAVTSAGGNQFLIAPLDTSVGAYNGAQFHSFRYEADHNSFELNARIRGRLGPDRLVLMPDGQWQRECTPGRISSFYGGLRYISLDEEFNFSALGFVPTTPDPRPSGSYTVNTRNDLFGFQLGGDLVEQHCGWSWGLRGKLGALVNFADQHSQVVIVDASNPSPERDERARDEQLTFLAEAGITATYQVRPNLALRASYDFMYLQGVALAPQQLAFNTAPDSFVRTGNRVFYDGASFGIEWIW